MWSLCGEFGGSSLPWGNLCSSIDYFSLFVVQFLVLVWWVMVFGFLGGGDIYLVVGGGFVLPYSGGQ